MPFLLLVGLDVFIWAIGGLIFCLLGNTLVKALAPKQSGALGFITTIVTAVPAAFLKLTQKIVSTFAPATVGPQRVLAAGLDNTTQLVDDASDLVTTHAAIVAMLADALSGAASHTDVSAAVAGLVKRVGNAEQQAKGIGADVISSLRAAEKSISHDVTHRINTLDKALTKDIAVEKARARGVEKGLAGDISRLWDWTKTHPWTVVTDAFVGATAIALSRLGLDWIKCETAKDVFKRRGCGLWNGLDKLVGLAALLAVGFTFQEFVDASETVAKAVGGFVADLEKPFNLALDPLPPPTV